MLWLTLLLATIVSVLAVGYVVWPLLRPPENPQVDEDDPLAELLGRKDALLRAIKELEFDHQVGKVDDETFQRLDQELRRQALVLLKRIEQMAPESTGLDRQLEEAIARHRRVPEPARQEVAQPAPQGS